LLVSFSFLPVRFCPFWRTIAAGPVTFFFPPVRFRNFGSPLSPLRPSAILSRRLTAPLPSGFPVPPLSDSPSQTHFFSGFLLSVSRLLLTWRPFLNRIHFFLKSGFSLPFVPRASFTFLHPFFRFLCPQVVPTSLPVESFSIKL